MFVSNCFVGFIWHSLCVSTLLSNVDLNQHLCLVQVNLTASMGTFDVEALVDGVSRSGEGKMHMSLSSPLLSALNKQLQFVTYTNTIFHPNTADIGELTCGSILVLSWTNFGFFKPMWLVKYEHIHSQEMVKMLMYFVWDWMMYFFFIIFLEMRIQAILSLTD